MPYLTALYAALRRLAERRDGNVAMIFGLVFIPVLIAAAGMAIDITRTYDARVRLSAALDAAALAVASTLPASGQTSAQTNAELTAQLNNYLAANYPSSAIGRNVSATMSDPTQNVINLNATATVDMTFMKIIGFNSITLNVASQVTKGNEGLEVALALDNTGSMLSNNNIQAVREDAVDLVNTLFGATTNTNLLRVSVVPFVTAVNVGPTLAQQGGFLNTAGLSYDSAQTDDTKWKGCVMEPQYPADISESTSQWPKQYRWDNNSDNVLNKPDSSSNVHINHASTGGLDDCNLSAAQNNSCPTPITPLTNDQQALTVALNAMQAWCLSGTMINVGLAWGWRTISPDSVFSSGSFSFQPKPYRSVGWKKALILMTDGQNQVFQGCDESFTYSSSQGGVAPFFGGSRGQNPKCKRWSNNGNGHPQTPGSGMTPYGRLDDGNIGKGVPDPANGGNPSSGAATIADGQRLMDEETKEACAAMKAQGVTVYTIAFTGAASGSITMLQNCASDPSKFFNAPDQATLKTAFEQIAKSLNTLRISQ